MPAKDPGSSLLFKSQVFVMFFFCLTLTLWDAHLPQHLIMVDVSLKMFLKFNDQLEILIDSLPVQKLISWW